MDEQHTNQPADEQPEGPAAATPITKGATAEDDPLQRRWSWGAFILDPFFVLAIRKYLFLLLYILYFIPLVNFIAAIGIKIFLGIKGADMVRESEAFENDNERRGFLKAINHAGFIVFVFTLALVVLVLLITAVTSLSFLNAS